MLVLTLKILISVAPNRHMLGDILVYWRPLLIDYRDGEAFLCLGVQGWGKMFPPGLQFSQLS